MTVSRSRTLSGHEGASREHWNLLRDAAALLLRMRTEIDENLQERTMAMILPRTFHPDPAAQPYRADPASTHRVKFDARVDFTNGGYVEAKDFLLDIEGDSISLERLAEMIVSSMNLLRAGPVTITAMRVVRRGEHQDATPAS